MSEHKISTFDGEYGFLSNFYPCTLTYKGITWPHSESAYQAMKSSDPAIHQILAKMMRPGEAKRYGKRITLRSDWEDIKLDVMHDIVTAKFDQNPELQRKLLLTGFCELEEGNTWGDTIWGVCPPNSGNGENMLGIILMNLRSKYISALPVDPAKIYAGIGSRETPPDMLAKMSHIAFQAAQAGWTLRSGGADGADSSFESGCARAIGARQIFLPWPQFSKRYSEFVQPSTEAYELAADIHVRWKHLSPGAKSLIARNMHQIVGRFDAFPQHRSKCVVCWTQDGCEKSEEYSAKTGGTGSAIFLADTLGIPVFNLKNPGRYEDAMDFLLVGA